MHEYDLIADWYAKDRGLTTGVDEVHWLIAMLDQGASVVDVGCGNGVPLTRTLLAAGCKVVGVDSSPRMLERFAWGVLFHLEHEEQKKAIAKIAEALKIGGLFLFTSGDEDGSIEGKPMNDVPFRYWSFTVEGYRELLRLNGLVPWGSSWLLVHHSGKRKGKRAAREMDALLTFRRS